MERVAYDRLRDNIDTSIHNHTIIQTSPDKRLSRAKMLINNNAAPFDNISEWNYLLNAYSFINFNISRSIDFNKYHISSEFMFNNNDPSNPPPQLPAHVDEPSTLDDYLNNMLEDFFVSYQDQTIDLYETLFEFIEIRYLGSDLFQKIHRLYAPTKTETDHFDTLRMTVQRLINALVIERITFDNTNNDPELITKYMTRYLDTFFPERIDNLPDSSQLKLPSLSISNLMNYSIILKNGNRITANIPDSIRAFNRIFESKLQILPVDLYLHICSEYIVNAVPNDELQEVNQNIVITDIIDKIDRLDINSFIDIEPVISFHPLITLDTRDDNLKQVFLDIDSFRTHERRFVSAFIDDYFIIQLFIFTSAIYNRYELSKAYNLMKYMSTCYDFTKPLSDSNSDLQSLNDSNSNSDPNRASTASFNVEPITHPVARTHQPFESTFDAAFVYPRSMNFLKYGIHVYIFFSLIVAAVLLIAVIIYHRSKPTYTPSSNKYIESFMLLNALRAPSNITTHRKKPIHESFSPSTHTISFNPLRD